jgi:hypothetical protein
MRVFDDFMTYGGGVYRHVTGNFLGWHAVLVIGMMTIGGAGLPRTAGRGIGANRVSSASSTTSAISIPALSFTTRGGIAVV